ncbi:hypothetical protein BDA99DRAFT_600118 [Phascolomyces articulosus]|uniref:F-box domain-containing protein n=1 Tax=Phascolomyces articulosus TaxID=60185 RepID=A0AAD5PKB7_9FUNG|nr:hypothetical protein BDA99DRAFT_600118 [Phascolomyces articulosus]
MPLFQQIVHNVYDALPETRFIKRDIPARQRKAEKMIQKSPNKAKGYLELAKIYIEQNKLRTAIEVYDNGMKHITVSLDNILLNSTGKNIANNVMQKQKMNGNNNTGIRQKTHARAQQQRVFSKNRHDDENWIAQQEDLVILQKERQITLAILVQLSRKFHATIPYEILGEIFSYLNCSRELLECTKVCKHWCKCMMTLPYFWNKMSPPHCTNMNYWPTIIITNQYKSSHKVYVRKHDYYHAEIVLHLDDLLNLLLSVSDDHDIEKLSKM